MSYLPEILIIALKLGTEGPGSYVVDLTLLDDNCGIVLRNSEDLKQTYCGNLTGTICDKSPSPWLSVLLSNQQCI
jgi:hypothetical protein